MSEPEDTERLHEPDAWEFETAFSGPAPLANRWFITTHNATVRLGFCEQYNEAHSPQFRAAITLDHHDALALAETLYTFMKRRDAAIYGTKEPIAAELDAETAAAEGTGKSRGLLGDILDDLIKSKRDGG